MCCGVVVLIVQDGLWSCCRHIVILMVEMVVSGIEIMMVVAMVVLPIAVIDVVLFQVVSVTLALVGMRCIGVLLWGVHSQVSGCCCRL